MSPEEIEALQKRIEDLESVVMAFATAYRLHKGEDLRVSNLKSRMVMNTSIEDWRKAFVLMFGEEKVQVEEVVE